MKKPKLKAVRGNSTGNLNIGNTLRAARMHDIFLYSGARSQTATGKECKVRYYWSVQHELLANIYHIFRGTAMTNLLLLEQTMIQHSKPLSERGLKDIYSAPPPRRSRKK